MRPLNSKEANASGTSRIWRVLSKYNSVTQTTVNGKPLPERINGRNFFTFDKSFGEKSSTREVYSEVAEGITKSAVSGLNGTIFAYGQTSSGKTYTMQGGGTIEDGADGGEGGIVHMAARDIFSHIGNDSQRVFLIRVSFVEIYNEEVRDLLVSENAQNVLRIRQDPRRGVFVDATENLVTDFRSLLSTLFAGEKNRAFASTEMNERSSRSHTIFRITIESRNKPTVNEEEENESDEDEVRSTNSRDDDDEAVRISTLNLVDLAGSESVKHTGATGERQKEGGKINQR
jgi:centromeric protein E